MIVQVIGLLLLGVTSCFLVGLFGRDLWEYYTSNNKAELPTNLHVPLAYVYVVLGLIGLVFTITRLNDAWQAWRFNVYMRGIMSGDE